MRRVAIERRTRVGAAARRRIREGGPTSTHRQALSVEGYRELSRLKFESQAWRCAWCTLVKPLNLDHAVNRSQGAPDCWGVTLGLCGGPGGCHDRKIEPFASGRRLVTIPVGGVGLIDLLLVAGPSKHDYVILQRKVIGRAPTTEERAILEALR